MNDTDANRTVLHQTSRLPLGQWNDFVCQMKWFFKDDGFVNAWCSGVQIIAYRGPVGYNDDKGPMFKFGLYRDESISTQVIYFDRIRRGNSLAEVDPSP